MRAKAAERVLANEPAAQTPESGEARRALVAEGQAAETDVTKRVGEVLNRATVRQGGGSEITSGTSLSQKVDGALDASLQRKFPRFSDADHPDWSKVAQRARQGSTTALEAIGHQGDTAAHAVTASILQYITSWKTGAQVRDEFTGGEYGWPRDAVDGALVALVASGLAKARDRAQAPVDVSSIRTTDIASTSFERETDVLSAHDRLKVKAILSDLGVPVQDDAYNEGVGRLVERIEQAAVRASGEPPLPEAPDLETIRAIKSLSGNAALRAVLDNESALRELSKEVSDLDGITPQRLAQWDLLDRLHRHADGTGLGVGEDEAIRAIHNGRQVLQTPDPVAPILQQLVDDFRAADRCEARRACRRC